MDKPREWIEESNEFPKWIDSVHSRFLELCKNNCINLSNLELITEIIKKNISLGIDDGILMFAKETMDQEDFDYTFNPYYVIQVRYIGDKETLDRVNKLTIVDSSFREFFDRYYFSMNMTYTVSVNYAAHRIYNNIFSWYKFYIDRN